MLAPASPPKAAPVPELGAGELDAAAFRERHLLPGRPVVLRGEVAGWGAVSRWRDPEVLAAAAGERLFPASDPDARTRAEVPLADFWRAVFSGEGGAYTSLNATIAKDGRPGVMGNLAGDTGHVGLLPAERLSVTKVFGGRDTRCGVHFHPDTEALLCQVVGKKRVLLFPPSDRGRMYPVAWYSPHVCFSRAVFERDGGWPDLVRFPRLAEVHPLECEVGPGDLLYIPIYWWHVVWGLGTAICVTQFFRASFPRRYLAAPGLRANGLNRVGGLRLRYRMWRRGLVAGA